MCCSPWGCKESDTTELLNHREQLNILMNTDHEQKKNKMCYILHQPREEKKSSIIRKHRKSIETNIHYSKSRCVTDGRTNEYIKIGKSYTYQLNVGGYKITFNHLLPSRVMLAG